MVAVYLIPNYVNCPHDYRGKRSVIARAADRGCEKGYRWSGKYAKLVLNYQYRNKQETGVAVEFSGA